MTEVVDLDRERIVRLGVDEFDEWERCANARIEDIEADTRRIRRQTLYLVGYTAVMLTVAAVVSAVRLVW